MRFPGHPVCPPVRYPDTPSETHEEGKMIPAIREMPGSAQVITTGESPEGEVELAHRQSGNSALEVPWYLVHVIRRQEFRNDLVPPGIEPVSDGQRVAMENERALPMLIVHGFTPIGFRGAFRHSRIQLSSGPHDENPVASNRTFAGTSD